MKFIGNKISHQEKNNIFSVVIIASISKGKEALIAAWLFCWTLCGLYFVYSLFGNYEREVKLYLAVLLSFWAFYEYRIVMVYLWRKYGYESIKISGDKLFIKEAIGKRGKVNEYFIQNIQHFTKLKVESSFIKTLDNSFWIKGNGYLQFEHLGKLVSFGKQLENNDLAQLHQVMQQALIQHKRALANRKSD